MRAKYLEESGPMRVLHSVPDMFVRHSLYEGPEFLELLAVDAVGDQGVGQAELLVGGLAVVSPLVGHVEDVLEARVVSKQLLVESETYLVPVLLQERTADLQHPTGRAAQSHPQVYNDTLIRHSGIQNREGKPKMLIST